MSVTSERMNRLIAALDPEGAGDISEAVKAAVRAVPRHLFIPSVGLVVEEGDPYLIDRNTEPGTWWDTVYSRSIIVTQLDDGGTPLVALHGDSTSSASAPSTVADLLTILGPEPGDRVLEIGTGTGWTAALLSHLVGDQGAVTSIEVDATIAEQAAKNLGDAGCRLPRLLVGDGALGCADGAPYDRVHVTCGIRTIPYTWVEQCRPGGVIVLPWHPGYGTSHALRLEAQEDGTAVGRVAGFAGYMMMRSQRPRPGEDPPQGQGRRHYRTALDPRALNHVCAGADLAIAALTGLRSHTTEGYDEDGAYVRTWVFDPDDSRSWAVATWRPDTVDHGVQQVGERPVYDEVLQAYAQWVSWGEPHWRRFGITVTSEGQQVWLDTPERVLDRTGA